MRITKRQAKATSLDHAIELAKRHAKERRLPSKVMADLMGVELKTYYRWLLENTLPLNRIAQFEALTGSRFISEYLSVLHGDRVVIEIPRGRKGKAADMAQVQSQTAAALALLAKWHEDGSGVDDGHSFKAKIRHPMGYLFTPEVTMIVDGCSGAVVGWSVALSETAVAVADALRHGMTHFPPPLGYYSDNGSGETGDMLDKETTGILPRIGIEHFTGIPGNPQGRGKIERLWQTITIPLAKQYATYQGKDADAETLRKVSNALASAQKVQKKGKELSKAQEAALAAAPTWSQFIADLEEAVRPTVRRWNIWRCRNMGRTAASAAAHGKTDTGQGL